MRVLLLHSPLSGSLVESYAGALRRRGFDTSAFDLLGALARAGRPVPGRILRRVARSWIWDRVGRELLAQFGAQHFDWLLAFNGREYSAKTLAELKRRCGARLICIHPENPFDPQSSSRRHLEALPHFDRYFAFEPSWIPRLLAAGAAHAQELHFARDPELHRPVAPATPPIDLAFVGCWDRERQRWLEPLAGRQLELFGEMRGEHWRRGLERCFRGGPIDVETTNAVYSRARIVLNLVRDWNRREGRGAATRLPGAQAPDAGVGHNMRSFEAPACGAFVLSTRTAQLSRLFREGEEFECFGTREELLAKVDRYLADDAGRRRIADAGRRRVQHETYDQRLETILESLATS